MMTRYCNSQKQKSQIIFMHTEIWEPLTMFSKFSFKKNQLSICLKTSFENVILEDFASVGLRQEWFLASEYLEDILKNKSIKTILFFQVADWNVTYSALLSLLFSLVIPFIFINSPFILPIALIHTYSYIFISFKLSFSPIRL